jgi:excinuclease ABC subunit C
VRRWIAQQTNSPFEQAAIYRDQIRALRQVQDKQYVESGKGEDVDVVTVVAEDGLLCVNLAMVRGGRHLGDKPQFPTNAGGSSPPEVLAAFLYQHYLSHPIPMRIYVNLNVSDTEVASTLGELAGRPVPIVEPRLTMQKVWVEMAEQNARLAILARRATLSRQSARLDALREVVSWTPMTQARRVSSASTSAIRKANRPSPPASSIKATGCRSPNIADSTSRIFKPATTTRRSAKPYLRRYEKVASGESVAPSLS